MLELIRNFFIPNKSISEDIPNSEAIETLTRRFVNLSGESPQQAAYHIKVLNIVAITSCALSILFTLITVYIVLATNLKRLKFRHKLILFLLSWNFLKAVFVIPTPIIMFSPNFVGFSKSVENFLGFFIACSIEAGDIVILTFAFYSLITMYHPTTGEKWLNSKRYYVYTACTVISATLAALGFISPVGYVTLQNYVYLPFNPIWYRLGLAWIPRGIIVATILCIYFYIYFHMRSQLNRLQSDIQELINSVYSSVPTNTEGSRNSFDKSNIQPVESKGNWIQRFISSLLHTDTMSEDQTLTNSFGSGNNNDYAPFDINLQFQLTNQLKMKTRLRSIKRQLREIFLYPLAYLLIWVFPFASFMINVKRKKSYPIGVLAAFFLTLNGCVDASLFLYREKPWRLTYGAWDRYHPQDELNWFETEIPRWRVWLRWLPLYGIPQAYLEAKSMMAEDYQFDEDQMEQNVDSSNGMSGSTRNPPKRKSSSGHSGKLFSKFLKNTRSDSPTLVSSSQGTNIGNVYNSAPPTFQVPPISPLEHSEDETVKSTRATDIQQFDKTPPGLEQEYKESSSDHEMDFLDILRRGPV